MPVFRSPLPALYKGLVRIFSPLFFLMKSRRIRRPRRRVRRTHKRKSRGSFAKRVKSIVLRQEETKQSQFGYALEVVCNATTVADNLVYIIDLNYQVQQDLYAQIPSTGGTGLIHNVYITKQYFKGVWTNQNGQGSGTSFAGPVVLYCDVISSPLWPSQLAISSGTNGTGTFLATIMGLFGLQTVSTMAPATLGAAVYDPNKCTVVSRRRFSIVPRFSGEACIKDIAFRLTKAHRERFYDTPTLANTPSKKNYYLLISGNTGSLGTAGANAAWLDGFVITKYKTA